MVRREGAFAFTKFLFSLRREPRRRKGGAREDGEVGVEQSSPVPTVCRDFCGVSFAWVLVFAVRPAISFRPGTRRSAADCKPCCPHGVLIANETRIAPVHVAVHPVLQARRAPGFSLLVNGLCHVALHGLNGGGEGSLSRPEMQKPRSFRAKK